MPSNAVSVNHCHSHQQMFSQLLLLAAPLPHFWLISSLLLANIGHATANSAAASGSSVAEEQHFSRHHHRSSSNSHELAAMAAQGYGYQQSGSRLSAGSGGGQRLNRCYSCMSPLYEQLFKDGDFGSFFFEPRNFTAQCEGPNMDTRGIGLVPCRGICLSLAQEFIIMGRKTGKRLWMRGCAHSLSRHGYQNRTIAYFAEFDLCRQLLASELFRLTSGDHSAEFADGFMGQSGPMDSQQSIMVCSCLGDRCNSQSSSGHRSSHSFPGIGLSLLLLFLALLSPCFTAEYPPYATFNIHFVYFFATK